MTNTKQIQLNVNIFFTVPQDYEVTNTESITFLGSVKLSGENDFELVFSPDDLYHETIESTEVLED